MSVIMDGCDAVDGDIGRQQGIQAVDETLDVRDGLPGVEMRYHQTGIHAGIGAARTSDGGGSAQ